MYADPDPEAQINADPDTDPDPKPCGTVFDLISSNPPGRIRINFMRIRIQIFPNFPDPYPGLFFVNSIVTFAGNLLI